MAKLPVFEMVIDENVTSDVEVSHMALVDKPAIEKNFLAFKNQRLEFTTIPEKNIVFGPAMIPDMLIYRQDENGEYNVFFSPETIHNIALKFFKKGYEKNVNLFHDPNLKSESVTIFQSFISNKEMGIAPMKGYEDLPDGTWFIGAKVEDPKIWDMVINGAIKGFSVEGVFSYVKKEKTIQEAMADLLNGTDRGVCHLSEIEFMSKAKELFQKFFGGNPNPAPTADPVDPAKAPDPTQNLGSFKLKDGSEVTCDKLEVGGVIMQGDVPVAAGVYELEDGTKVTVGDGGVITLVEAGQMQPATTDYSAQFTEINNKFQTYEMMFNEQKQLVTTLTANFNNANKKIDELIQVVGKLIETPTADPVAQPSNGFVSERQKDKFEKRTELANLLSKIKK